MKNESHLDRIEKMRCIICGEVSTNLIENICDKPACSRHREENKAIVAMDIAHEYTGQGYA